jgi:hydroxymethylbilane synthase
VKAQPIYIATRGSALALAQANTVLALCRAACPDQAFDLKILKTTGDKLQTASLANPAASLPKGLFTKELEVALLNGEASLAVHSLKDLPTELPEGLELGAVLQRADPRDALIYRDAAHPGVVGRAFAPGLRLRDLPDGLTLATSSPRRAAQILAINPKLKTIPVRGNVATRLEKLAQKPEFDAMILACAGMDRLHFTFHPDGRLTGASVPDGLLVTRLDYAEMLPAVGQAAIGIETCVGDARIAPVLARLNDATTLQCVTAERAFLRAMGGGCQAPVAALAEIQGAQLTLRIASFTDAISRQASGTDLPANAAQLGERLAREIKG